MTIAEDWKSISIPRDESPEDWKSESIAREKKPKQQNFLTKTMQKFGEKAPAAVGRGVREGLGLPGTLAESFGWQKPYNPEATEQHRLPTIADIRRVWPGPPRSEMSIPEKYLERTSRNVAQNIESFLPPTVALPLAAGQGIVGQTLEEFGASPETQERWENITPLAKSAGKFAYKVATSPKATMQSGLTQLIALKDKWKGWGKYTTEAKEGMKEILNVEGEELAEKILKKHIPITSEILESPEAIVKIEKENNAAFAEVEKLAKKFPVQIDVSPINQFHAEKKLLPGTLPSATDKIAIAEAKEWKKASKTRGKNGNILPHDYLLELYRKTGEKITTLLSEGTPDPNVLHYLTEYKQSITQALENSFPKDNKWFQQFLKTNARKTQLHHYEESRQLLGPLFTHTNSPKQLENLLTDRGAQKQLGLTLGEQGRVEANQLISDLAKSHDAIRRLPRTSHLATVSHSTYGILGTVGKMLGYALTGANASGRFMAHILSRPDTRQAFGEILTSVKNDDYESWISALVKLKSTFESDLPTEQEEND